MDMFVIEINTVFISGLHFLIIQYLYDTLIVVFMFLEISF